MLRYVLPLILALALSPLPAFSEDAKVPFNALKQSLDVGVIAHDAEAMKEFYTDVMGLKLAPGALPLPGGGKMYRFNIGTTTLKLLELAEAPPKHPGGIQTGVGLRLMTYCSADIDGVVERAVAAGIKRPTVMGKPGKRILFIMDPDGNQLELLEAEEGSERLNKFWIGLTVADVEASRKFYGEIFGLEELEPVKLFGTSGPDKYQFVAGDTTLKFWAFDPTPENYAGPWMESAGIRYYTFMVPDVDAAHEELVKRGATIAEPPMNFGGLARIMFVQDPDGNYIEFAQIGGKRKK